MEVIHFGMVGVINTLMGWGIMAVLYNLIHWNYWVSSGISYFIGSVFSYHANSKVTFKVEKKDKDKALVWRFAANIIVCYLVAYTLAQPAVQYVLALQSVVNIDSVARTIGMESAAVVDNIAMIVGMGLFIVLNFFGQKFLVFRKTKAVKKERAER